MSKVSQIKALSGHSGCFKKSEESEFSFDEPEWNRWPTLDKKAFFGFAGEFVELATENSEADPAAILTTFLTRFGVECGPRPFIMIGDTKHHPRIFSVIVGATSKARKGTSGKPVLRLFELGSALPYHPHLSAIEYATARMLPGPLSSGEEIIYQVKDEKYEWNMKTQEDELKDPGISDKRLFILDEEFASALTCTKREGNILTTIIRGAWDTGTLEPITKNSRIKATGAHIGICTHITKAELDKKMNETEVFNGFANRFLWCCAKRSKLVALPPPMPDDMLSKARNALMGLISKALDIEEMRFNGYAREHYGNIYPN